MDYNTIIGLEVHVELNTKTKAYCACESVFGGEVNSKTCPGCLGLPGTLPTLNKESVQKAVIVGTAFGSEINRLSKQDRKNYFYPDTAKAYQISQSDIPLCKGGEIEFIADEEGNTKKVRLDRIQVEEDAAKLLHNDSFEDTLIDFNRSGVPLIEIVTQPDLRSSEDTRSFLESLRASLIALGVTDGKMQEGSIRCDVNVSVSPVGSDKYGTRVEMKNINTFSGAARAVEYESARQIALVKAGVPFEQETRRWDDVAGENSVMRTKGSANDYRYFPDPDLGLIEVTDEMLAIGKASVVELPYVRTLNLVRNSGISLYDANLLVDSPEKYDLFLGSAKIGGIDNSAVANWILGDITRFLNEKQLTLKDSMISPEKLVDMIKLIEAKTISSAAGKTIIDIIMTEDKTPAQVVVEKNLGQISDMSQLESIVKKVVSDNPQTIEQFRAGKTNVVGFLVGQSMKASKGQGNPEILKDLVMKALSE